MAEIMIISVIIPTHNRYSLLGRTLLSIIKQVFPREKFEIIVVDNNSSDRTRETVTRLQGRHKTNIRYIYEYEEGLHYARNRGIKESRGGILVFLDDDVRLFPNYLNSIIREFSEHKDTGMVGGKVIPEWETKPSSWVYSFEDKNVSPALSYMDLGNKRMVLENGYLFGCSMAIKRDIAIKIGGSDPDTFSHGSKYFQGNGENAMMDRARAINKSIVYNPEIAVYHWVGRERLSISYFFNRYERFAYESVNDYLSKIENRNKRLAFLMNLLNCLANNCWFMMKSIVKAQQKHFVYYLVISYYYLIQIIHMIRLRFDDHLYQIILRRT